MTEALREGARQAWPELSPEQLERLQAYYARLVAENERQNLTRLISTEDFIEGHLIDVRELLNSGAVSFPAADLGSGAGVPGLLAAALYPDQEWRLIESEGQKARFLQETVDALKLGAVRVFSGRGEDVLKKERVQSVVARAVGPIDRIYHWLRPCSTWNNLVLLKGPKWDEEWSQFQKGPQGPELKEALSHTYRVGAEQKYRVIIRLSRVPRGTTDRPHR